MNFTNPAGLSTREQREALIETLFAAEQPEVFRRPPPLSFPANQIPLEKYLTLPEEDLRDLIVQLELQRDDNSSQPQWRSPKDQEATALIFTFGEPVGKILTDIIKIRQGEEETDDETHVLLDEEYNPDDLESLGDFIYKATGVWQRKVGLYSEDEGESDYNYKQLYVLKKLNGKQHAGAVRDWFYVSYGIVHRLIGDGANQMTLDPLWKIILEVLGVDFEYRSEFGKGSLGGNLPALQQIVNNHYVCVIKEIQDGSKFHRLGQNAPNPA